MKYVDKCDPHIACHFYYSELEIEELRGGNDR